MFYIYPNNQQQSPKRNQNIIIPTSPIQQAKNDFICQSPISAARKNDFINKQAIFQSSKNDHQRSTSYLSKLNTPKQQDNNYLTMCNQFQNQQTLSSRPQHLIPQRQATSKFNQLTPEKSPNKQNQINQQNQDSQQKEKVKDMAQKQREIDVKYQMSLIGELEKQINDLQNILQKNQKRIQNNSNLILVFFANQQFFNHNQDSQQNAYLLIDNQNQLKNILNENQNLLSEIEKLEHKISQESTNQFILKQLKIENSDLMNQYKQIIM